MSRRRWWALLLGIVAVGLTIRIVYAVGWRQQHEFYGGDAVYYHLGSNLLADGEGFPQPITLAFRLQREPGAEHPPGYIVYLAVASKFGFRSVTDHQVWSAFLGAASVLLIGIVARRLVGPKLALLAAALAAISTNMWVPDASIMSETLAIFATVLVLYLSYRCWDDPRPMTALALGVAVGIAAMSRSELIALAPLIVPLIFWQRRRVARRPLVAVAVAGVAVAAVIAPWAIYNSSRFDHPVILSNQLPRTMAASWCKDGFYGARLGYKSYTCLNSRLKGATTEEQNRNFTLAWKTYAKGNIERAPVVMLARVGRTWNLYRPYQQRDFEADDVERPLATAALYTTWLLFFLAAVGACKLRARGVPLFPFWAVIIDVSLTSALTFGQIRYRAPAEPVLILLAVAAFLPSRRSTPAGVQE
jgi:4-amino-4-deoxy-L-arabinose transferase-like glycosyltransferase